MARKNRGEITIKILSALKDAVLNATDLIDVILTSGYGTSLSGFEYALSQKEKSRAGVELAKELAYREHQRYYSFIYNLKRDGILIEKITRGKKILKVTIKGLKRLKLLKDQINRRPISGYEVEKSDNIVIVVFDVPEKERKRREWLRAILKNIGLKMIQKSVWMGKLKIPQQFLEELRRFKILSYVEIFEVTKSGSLHSILDKED